MKSPLVLGILCAALLVTFAGLGFGDDEPQKPMSEMEMFQKAMELAKPGPMHEKVLSRFAGDFKAEGKMFTETMGAIPITGQATNEWILGKRFLETTYEGPFMTGTFEGRALIGYDNMKKTFQQVWIMTMGTGMDVMQGSWDEAKQTLTWTHDMQTPDGRTWKKRDVWECKGDAGFLATSYATGPDGEEFKEMELMYSRVQVTADDTPAK